MSCCRKSLSNDRGKQRKRRTPLPAMPASCLLNAETFLFCCFLSRFSQLQLCHIQVDSIVFGSRYSEYVFACSLHRILTGSTFSNLRITVFNLHVLFLCRIQAPVAYILFAFFLRYIEGYRHISFCCGSNLHSTGDMAFRIVFRIAGIDIINDLFTALPTNRCASWISQGAFV